MPGSTPRSAPALSQPIISAAEAARRLELLADLQTSLAGLGIGSVLARNHRLVLRWRSSGPYGPSGLTDPALHIFTPAGSCVATTDGTAYLLATGQHCPATDPAATAALICQTPTPKHDLHVTSDPREGTGQPNRTHRRHDQPPRQPRHNER